MPRPENPEAELRKAVSDCRAVIVSGTGISIAASRDPVSGKPHPEASWAGLLESGLEWLKEHNLISDGKAAAHLTLLKEDPDTHHFISAAQDITRLMGGADSPHFANWLERTVGSIKAHDRNGLDALEALREHGNLLATTNYDGLLLDNAGLRNPVTWTEPDEFLRAARNRETDKVIFLHGYWRHPQSVILDWASYEEITRDEQYREDLASVWKMTTWVYVGCGANGLSDPDFGLLMERYGKRARQADLWDFCLVRRSQREEFQAHFDKLKINVCAVSFGESHDDLPEFLRSLLPAPISPPTPAAVVVSTRAEPNPTPTPPAFYAEPDYIGSHQFVGRDSQLHELDDWARPADPTNLLLFEAIGGNGKSMLTWEWTTRHATQVRADWAGRFWYSFYERGAIMADFCQRALAYMTGQPLKELRKKKTAELKEPLLAQLHAKPWLLVLDGLERVLVAYHRIDAAEMPDEDANNPTDKIVNRNPRDTIRDEDNDLLRALAAATPSKILVSSRLTPRVLLNPSGQPITGAKRITLPGLRPADAKRLLRSCGIEGDSAAIQSYLTTNCDNHPLVIGILGGLINNYLPARGNFDAWAADGEGGAKLDLASLDLIQRRNHILRAALDSLPPASRQLLSTLALLSESVDYETLKAFNPHLPPEPKEVKEPTPLEDQWDFADGGLVNWEQMSNEQKAQRQKRNEAALARWHDYDKAVQARLESEEYREAAKKLAADVTDLEQRGLLQYDGRTRRHDLHPVVRGVTAGGMKAEDKESCGQRVVDHFSSLPHNPYEQAETLEDLRPGLNVVRTLIKLGHFQLAANACTAELMRALVFNVEAFAETLSLMRPFFPASWEELPKGVERDSSAWLANSAGVTLQQCGESKEAFAAFVASLSWYLSTADWDGTSVRIHNISESLDDQNLLTKALRVDGLAFELAVARGAQRDLFMSRLCLFVDQSRLGQWADAEATWQLLDPMGRKWLYYRPGDAERYYARFQYWRGTLQEEHLAAAERLAADGKNRSTIRYLHGLRGAWRLEQGEWAMAKESFAEALRMARESGVPDAQSETGVALAKHHLGQLVEPQREAERLAQLRKPAHRTLAQLWLALGDPEQVKHHALAAYRWAWADGEPYVNRYDLTKTTELLQQMNVPIPNLPPYDPAKDEPFPWEADVRAAIEKLRAEKEAKKHNTDV